MKVFDYLFKEFPPLTTVYEGLDTITLHFLGGLLIMSAFIITGLIFILLSKRTTVEKIAIQERRKVAKFIGWALVCCGVARGLDVIALWHNYANIIGIIKIVTGIVAYGALFYIPRILRLIKSSLTLDQAVRELKVTQNTMEKIIKLDKETK